LKGGGIVREDKLGDLSMELSVSVLQLTAPSYRALDGANVSSLKEKFLK